ncbi:MAG: dienelactone hydrolase family protein [Myxococcota bacterium]|nr:dienelactone hydrolase family protein [Myxococcota bacterium]
MAFGNSVLATGSALFIAAALAGDAMGDGGGGDCRRDWRPVTTFIEFESLDLEQSPPEPLTVKGKLKLPVRHHGWKCFRPRRNLPAVVILHGSSGVDFRGDFYARALNTAGIATLEIDMWEARGIVSAADRPPLPIFNYPDAFAALAFLSSHPNVDPERIGVLGFSWGAVITMASATELYASQFGGDLRFRAHVAHYPVCYAYNSGLPGTDFVDLTGFPLMIGIGELDDYDQGSAPCFALRDGLPEEEQDAVEVVPYEDAFHAWDRLQVPIEVMDPFSNLGAGGTVVIAPNVERAYESRRRVVRFFRRNL